MTSSMKSQKLDRSAQFDVGTSLETARHQVWGSHYYLVRKITKEAHNFIGPLDGRPELVARLIEEAVLKRRYDERTSKSGVLLVRIDCQPYLSNTYKGAVISAYLIGSNVSNEKRVSRHTAAHHDGQVWIDKDADIKVDSGYHGWGIGRLMISHAIRWGRSYHPHDPIKPLFPTPSKGPSLRRFYRLNGFDFEEGARYASYATSSDVFEMTVPAIPVSLGILVPALARLALSRQRALDALMRDDTLLKLAKGSWWLRIYFAFCPKRAVQLPVEI